MSTTRKRKISKKGRKKQTCKAVKEKVGEERKRKRG